MKLKLLILIFVFLISLNIVNAVVNTTRTTYDTFANGSASLSLGNYSIAFGSLEGIGTQMNGFSNDSAVLLVNNSASAIVSRSVGHFNFTAGTAGKIALRSGFTSKTVQKGMACDIQFRFHNSLVQVGISLGLSDAAGDAACTGGSDNAGMACIGAGDAPASEVMVQVFAGGTFSKTVFGHKAKIGETINTTLIYDSDGSSAIFVGMNNSARRNASVTGETLDILPNMSIGSAPDASPPGLNVSWFACYNATLGAPMTAAAVIDTTPQEILELNMTSEATPYIVNLTNPFCFGSIGSNCHVPRTNDTTPTFRMRLSEAGNCTVIDLNRNLNYSDIYRGNSLSAKAEQADENCAITLNDTNVSRIGIQNFSVSGVDDAGNQNSTATYFFSVNITDRGAPNITLFTLANNTVFRVGVNFTLDSTIIQFNWSATDNYDTSLSNCSIWVNNIMRHNVTNYANGTIVSSNLTMSSDATNIPFNVTCYDSYNNFNESAFRVFDILFQQFNVNVTIRLNGTNESRKYEFNTTLLDKDYGVWLNVTVTPNTTVCIDYDYLVNWTCVPGNTSIYFNVTELNITKFENGNFSINLSSTIRNVTIRVDNNTDLIKVEFKIRGFDDGGFPVNATFDLNKDNIFEIIIPGRIKNNEIEINEFIQGNTKYLSVNLTFSSAGSRTININATSLIGVKNFTMFLRGYDIDPVGAEVIENFTSSVRIASTNLSAPFGVYDDYERNSSTKVTSGDGCVNVIQPATSGDDYLYVNAQLGSGGQCDVTVTDIDIKKYHNVTFKYTEDTGEGTCGGTSLGQFSVTDGTNTVNLFSVTRGANGDFDIISTIKRKSLTLWTFGMNDSVPKGGGQQGDKDLSSLDQTKKWNMKFSTSSVQSCCGIPQTCNNAFTNFLIYNINVSGAYLIRNDSGEYINQTVGVINFTTVVNTSSDIIRAAINASFIEPARTKIRWFLRNNNASAFDEVTVTSSVNPVLNIFTMTGNNLTGYVTMTTNDTTVTPEIYEIRFIIIPGTIKNVSVDFGSDGDTEWTFEDRLNSTTSPRRVNGSLSDFVTHRSNNCLDTKTCSYPLSIITKTAGIVEISDLNLTQRTVTEGNNSASIIISNLSILEPITIWNWTVGFLNGRLLLYDLDIEFFGSKNISLPAHSSENASYLLGTANLSLQMYHSKFKANHTKGVSFYNVFPTSKDSKNVTPFSQTFLTPIYNITTLAYDLPIDTYIRYNSTFNCTTGNSGNATVFYSNSSNRSEISSLNFTANASFKFILQNISKGLYQLPQFNQTVNVTLNGTNASANFTFIRLLIVNEQFSMRNSTGANILLNRDIDYKINFTSGNFTLINSTFNMTKLFATYNYSISTPWKGIWNFWDFTNCTKRFIIPKVIFQTYCQGCVT